jgi:hypothetical protein
MDYVYLIVAVLVSVHVFSYGLWVKKQGNRAGAIFIFGLGLVCVGLPVYRIVASP